MADENITIGKNTFYGLIIASLLGLLILSVVTQGFGIIKPVTATNGQNAGSAGAGNLQPPAPNPAPAQPSVPGQLTVKLGNLPPLGKDSAPVSIVEFSDFQCPFCRKLFYDAEAQIKTNYIDTGKVKWYYRDFPLNFHPSAIPAAMAARCANDQGKFWEMHDKIFQEQNKLGQGTVQFSVGDIKSWASQITGLDMTAFNTCMDSNKYINEINADALEGQGYGVQGTPGSYILIPKNRISATDIQSAILSTQGLQFFENSNEYIVFVAGAYPYSAFDAVLSKVSY